MKYLIAIALALSFNVTNTMYLEKLTQQQISQKRIYALKSLAVFAPCLCTVGALYGLSDYSSDSVSMARGALTGLTIALFSTNIATDRFLKKTLPASWVQNDKPLLLPM